MRQSSYLFLFILFSTVSLMVEGECKSQQTDRPNLLIIQTDEHNFRTLGCYRRQLTFEQAHVWGPGVRVDTPNIDSMAKSGAMFTRFYAASPVCTPSRASFVSGLYPQATGAPKNNLPLRDDVLTFAEVLRDQGYATSYVGKWHLDGNAKPGWAPTRKFGFDDNRYMFNRGHWKKFELKEDQTAQVAARKNGKPTYDLANADDSTFATDFLTDRVIDIMERDKDQPFCIMLALPDPHGPNTVREPYNTMYQNFVFEQPTTMTATLNDPGSVPKWNKLDNKNQVKRIKQEQMVRYFGMVKCIDDNVGKMLKFLDDQGIADNTVVVFTSDHGDMMCEHCRNNKGLPYETSAKIPFIVKYPNRIPAGKIIKTAYTTVDFFPTMMELMAIPKPGNGESGTKLEKFLGQRSTPAPSNFWFENFHGQSATQEMLSETKTVEEDRLVYIRNSGGFWVAGMDNRYKLVLSQADVPWLLDLEKDPDELINFYADPAYKEIGQKLMSELLEQMERFNEEGSERLNLGDQN